MRSDRRSRHARTLFLGVTASVAIHALLFGVLRFHGDPLERPDRPEFVFETPEPVAVVEEEPVTPIQEASPVDASAPEMELVGESLAGAAATSAGDVGRAEPTPATAPLAGDPILPAAEESPDVSLTSPVLAVTEPALAVVRDVPEAETTSDELDESVPVWRPGTVGAAKRQWANNGSGAGERGRGDGVGIFIGRGGGHCPMPGRGRGRPLPPASWFN